MSSKKLNPVIAPFVSLRDSVKEFHHKHKKRINRLGEHIDFVRDCVNSAANMREEPGIVDYVDLVFNCRSAYQDHYDNYHALTDCFAGDEWVSPFSSTLVKQVVKLVTQYHSDDLRVIKENDLQKVWKAKVEKDLEFGWWVNENGPEGANIQNFWIQAGREKESYQFFSELFWRQFKSGRAVISADPSEKELVIKEDLNHGDFIVSKKCIDYVSYIKKFQAGNLSRSILFYGPPGSGKSNLVKGIIHQLGQKSLRFENLADIHNSFLTEIIQVMGARSIVLEDIDHMSHTDLTDLLDKIESFNHDQKLVFATANQASKLDNALLRPGRFDEATEIKKLETEVVMQLVQGDEELFGLVEDFPVAFIVELMKRVKILGKEEALSNVKDLLDRMDNFGHTNYSLRIDGEEDEDDENLDDEED